jgi:hypothetical protein
MLHESFKKSKVCAISLIILGVFLFLYNLIRLYSLSTTALVSLISGIALLSLSNAASIEIDKLRTETIEIRKTAEKSDYKINRMLE